MADFPPPVFFSVFDFKNHEVPQIKSPSMRQPLMTLNKSISGCRLVWDLICGTSWFYKSKTEKVTGGGKSAILPNWCCLLSITVLFTHPWYTCVTHKIECLSFSNLDRKLCFLQTLCKKGVTKLWDSSKITDLWKLNNLCHAFIDGGMIYWVDA